jgi:leader peptidase (prepilin peptidase)/N-methyltransferase
MLFAPGFAALTLVLCGLCIGSFLNVCIYRLPLKQSVVRPASRCPGCGNELAWFDNIPVVSYLVLRGRCRTCALPISARYPIVEALTAAVFLALDRASDRRRCCSRPGLCVRPDRPVRDRSRAQILPDVITLPGIVVGFALQLAVPPALSCRWRGSSRRRVVVGDIRGLVPRAQGRGHGLRRREDAGDGGRLSGRQARVS